jgi:hypothetical protein
VDLYSIEQDAAGNVLEQSSTHLHLKLTEQEYRSYLQSGIIFHRQLQPKWGPFRAPSSSPHSLGRFPFESRESSKIDALLSTT